MRNEVHDDNENVSRSVVVHRARRRRQALVGVAGLVVLGAGAFLVTDAMVDSPKTETRDTAALASAAPETGSAPSSASTAPAASRGKSDSPSKSAAPSVAASQSVAEEIAAARAAAAKDGVKLLRPLKPQRDDVAAAAEVKVVNTGSLKGGGATLRVVSARGDLTGKRELGMVADKGTRVGNAYCSQTIRVSGGVKATKEPNLLLCWRTSAQKSVFTVAVDLGGDPSERKSVAAIDKEWRTMG